MILDQIRTVNKSKLPKRIPAAKAGVALVALQIMFAPWESLPAVFFHE